jgi:hypothetical protein
MLENIDSVAWSELTHAYGAASNVPGQIRKLAKKRKKTRKNALEKLYSNIFHQGTRYQATPHAVPFLYELRASPETPDRHDVVYLLVNLALGYEESYLPDGLDIVGCRRSAEQADSAMSWPDHVEYNKYGFASRVELDCYDAVKDGVPTLITLLNDDDIRLANAAVYALAWFPEYSWESLPAIRHHLSTATDDISPANDLLAIGLLARSSDGSVDNSVCHEFLSHESLIVRVAAAIALARDPLTDKTIEILVGSLQSTEELQGMGEDIHFNEGNLAGYASLVLARGGAEARRRIVPALCQTLKSVNPYQSLDVTRALLQSIIGDSTKPIKDIPAKSLDALQLAALRAIADDGGWKINGGVFCNYWELVRAYGVPDSQESLIEYLEQ